VADVESTAAHLHLVIDLESEPIAGSITDNDGERRFSGWIELATAIEHARTPLGEMLGRFPGANAAGV
jgi:hypothetical protein